MDEFDFSGLEKLTQAVENVEPVASNDYEDMGSLLVNLNKQVNSADTSVLNISKDREVLSKRSEELEALRLQLEKERQEFDDRMRDEFQKLNNDKAEFEQDKYIIYNEIQDTRENLAKEKREFEKYRRSEIAKIEQNKILLKKNYEQFNAIVATFNKKINKYKEENQGN